MRVVPAPMCRGNRRGFQYQILDVKMIFKAAVLEHCTNHCLFTCDTIYLVTCCKALVQICELFHCTLYLLIIR